MKVAIVGQGYVGLPLAQRALEAGHEVVGVDLNQARVELLNAGKSVIDDISDQEMVAMIQSGYRATADTSVYGDADVIVICVPTPLSQGNAPDLRMVEGAVNSVAERVSAGTLVVLESTTYPGTTKTVVVPTLEKSGLKLGENLFVAFSPERVDPGNPTYGIRNTPKVVGADDEESVRRAVEFYGSFVDEVVPVSGSAEAELTKLLENTYRHINIGLVNELALVCHELGIDVWEVVRAASTKPFGFQAFYPGPGVGGHCIPIDPNYLDFRVRQVLGKPFQFVELAQAINDSMPAYVVSRVQDLLNEVGKPLKGSRILLLGVAYKAGISDTRESPAYAVAEILLDKGGELAYFDPCVDQWDVCGKQIKNVQALDDEIGAYDAVVLLQNIKEADAELLAPQAQIFFDTRGATRGEKAARL